MFSSFSIDWNKPVQRTVYSSPWIEPSELNQSIATKFMHYKFEPNVVDPENPLQQGNLLPDLRQNERRSKKNRKVVETIDHVTGGLQEISRKDGKFFWTTFQYN